MTNPFKIALHPLALVIGLLAFLGTILGQPPFSLPTTITFPVVFAVAILTYVSAQLPAFHKDLVMRVDPATFKAVITALVSASGLIALLAQSLSASPYPLPPLVVYIMAALVSVISFVANQLEAVEGAPEDAKAADATATPAQPTTPVPVITTTSGPESTSSRQMTIMGVPVSPFGRQDAQLRAMAVPPHG